MAASSATESANRLESWIPLELEGKPLYHGIEETERMNRIRPNITVVRKDWNDVQACVDLRRAVEKTLNATALSRELRSELHAALSAARYWIDLKRSSEPSDLAHLPQSAEKYSALELYTTNAGYKQIFGHINQLFRLEEIDDTMIQGAVALVELLTIDVYNLRLDNFGCAKYYNFQGILHRGMKVSQTVLQAFEALFDRPLKQRNFSVPLSFVSTSADQKNIQEFLEQAHANEKRLHLKIHVRELDPHLLASYRQDYPDSIVSTICAMPISTLSEYPNEQEILLRGPHFQLLRMYEDQAAKHPIYVLEIVMLNANRDHGTELAHHHGKYEQQRRLFGQMCAATKYKICAALAKEYGQYQEAEEYTSLLDETIQKIGYDRPKTSLATANYTIWFYAQRRAEFSKALFSDQNWPLIERIIDDEYEWQKSDWCNVPRLYGTQEEARNSGGFTALHQAAYNNASPELVQKLVDLGGWRTMKAHQREAFRTPLEVAMQRNNQDLFAVLRPLICHPIPQDDLKSMEIYVHKIMNDLVGDAIKRYAVHLPQLNVLTEMEVENPSLWAPIPSIFGGFVLTLHPTVVPCVHTIYVSNISPKIEREYWINRDGIMLSHQQTK